MNLGKTIRINRLMRGLTQTQFADMMGISIPLVSLYERDLRTPPLEKLSKIAEIFDMPLVILIYIAIDASERKKLSEEAQKVLWRECQDYMVGS